MIHILIADDHAVVRTGLQLIFDATPDLTLVAELGTTHELLPTLAKQSCDVLILDVALPGRDTLDVLKDIRLKHPQLPVIMFSMYPEAQYANRYLQAGAAAYLNKERPPAVILEAVRQVIGGERYFPPGQAEEIARQTLQTGTHLPPDALLTDREFQVLRLLAEGKSKDEIATKLSISKNTLSNHRNNILKKLQLANNADLTRYAIRHGLIQ